MSDVLWEGQVLVSLGEKAEDRCRRQLRYDGWYEYQYDRYKKSWAWHHALWPTDGEKVIIDLLTEAREAFRQIAEMGKPSRTIDRPHLWREWCRSMRTIARHQLKETDDV